MSPLLTPLTSAHASSCFTATSTTEIYTLSLHDALPIFAAEDVLHRRSQRHGVPADVALHPFRLAGRGDRKSTRLNSSHSQISYAVFCLKKKRDNKHCGAP